MAPDKESDSPKGVGESTTRRGEDVSDDESKEAGRKDTGKEGEAQRPTGESSARDSTSIDPQGPIDEESPVLPPA